MKYLLNYSCLKHSKSNTNKRLYSSFNNPIPPNMNFILLFGLMGVYMIVRKNK
jgi:hypothetical protein